MDYIFHALHVLIIGFNLFGWIFPKTRLANLIGLSATGFFWLIVGIWYGFGYCPITDWHWQYKESQGEHNLPNNYIKYAFDEITQKDWDPTVVDWITGLAFAGAFIVSIFLNIKSSRARLHI